MLKLGETGYVGTSILLFLQTFCKSKHVLKLKV